MATVPSANAHQAGVRLGQIHEESIWSATMVMVASCMAEENSARKLLRIAETDFSFMAPKAVATAIPMVINWNTHCGKVSMLVETKTEPATITSAAAPMISHCCSERVTFGRSALALAGLAGFGGLGG